MSGGRADEVLVARGIGAPAATMLVVASMIGTGIFTTTGFLVEALRSPVVVLVAWAVGGLLALSGALSYAELSAALPRNGGEYHLLGRVYHPAVGFAAGIISLVVGFAAPIAASALAFGHYLAAALPGIPAVPAAVVVVLLFAGLHGVDVTWGSRFQSGVTAAQLMLIAGMAAAGLALGHPSRLLTPAPHSGLASILSPEFAVALVFVSFAYSGWNGAAYVAGEVRAPSRTLPLALVLGTVLVAALYMGLNVVYLAAAPPSDLAGVVEVANVAAQRLVGASAGRVLSGLIALVLASSVGAMTMAGSRVYEAMGCDHRPLSLLARRSARGAPAVAVAVQAALALAMVATTSFGTLLGFIGFTLSVSAGLTVLGVFVLRLREPRLARPYRALGYPVTPLLFLALSIWMIGHSLVERPVSSIAGVATIAAALALYVFVARAGSREPSSVFTEAGGDP
jgi:APA family basic amino acid/polyamine antiporter